MIGFSTFAENLPVNCGLVQVQCGLGRSGQLFAYDAWDEKQATKNFMTLDVLLLQQNDSHGYRKINSHVFFWVGSKKFRRERCSLGCDIHLEVHMKTSPAVDGFRNLAKTRKPGMVLKPCKYWDFNNQPQLVVSRISEPSTVSLTKTNCELNTCPGCTKKNAPPKDKAHLKCLRGV